MVDIYQEIVRIRTEGGEAALATIVSTQGSTPREVGSKMLIKSDESSIGSIGGGNVEAEVWREAKRVMSEGKPRILHFDLTGKETTEEGMICGGIMDVFVEPIQSLPTLYLLGAGHVSVPLSKMGKMAGFKVVVIDDRLDFASPESFPEADRVLCEELEKVFSTLQIGSSSYIVIATRAHQSDELVLQQALRTPATYVGMLASRKKRETIFSHLLADGIPQESLDKVHSPIGLKIRAQTPEEIAISILAEIIKTRHLR
jgi:xanthine dehydrogenase accessory factor